MVTKKKKNLKKTKKKYLDRLRSKNKKRQNKNINITYVSIPFISHLNQSLKRAFNNNNATHMHDQNLETSYVQKVTSIRCNLKVCTNFTVAATHLRLTLDRPE